ncbi:MAG: amidohydrolase [Chloroflexi bacterium]|nr:amidohydrolase [Chloroflexota bacterium]
MSGAGIVSGDSHIIEPMDLWPKAIGSMFGDRTPRIIDEYNGKQGEFFYTGPGGQVQTLPKLARDVEAAAEGDSLKDVGSDPAARVRYQDQFGIRAEVMNPTYQLAVFGAKDREVVRAAATAYNDWAAEFSSAAPTRLLGVGVIPPEDPKWAAGEVKRIAKKGLKGAIIPLEAPVEFPPYRDAVYDPLWAEAEAAGMPFTLHIVAGNTPHPMHMADQTAAPGRMMHIFYEIMQPLANDFIFGKIFDRFPRLRLIHSEFEISWMPSFMVRLDEMQDFAKRLPALKPLDMRASDYVRERVYHGLIADPFAQTAIPRLGADHVLWGTDFPHAHSVGFEMHETVEKLFGGLSEHDRELVTAGNAARLYGLN